MAAVLRQSVTQSRAILRRVLRGRITFTPNDAGGYTFEAPTRFDRLFSGIVVARPSFIKPGTRGCQHIGPDDTFDGDYGRLLERAYENIGKGSPPMPASWNQIASWLRQIDAVRQAA